MIGYIMSFPYRTLSTRGLVTYPDTDTQALTAQEISSWKIDHDLGSGFPIGSAAAKSFELKLDNRDGEWNPGGSFLGSHSLDGAVIKIEIGAFNPLYDPPYASVDGGDPADVFAESYDGGAPDEEFVDALDGGSPFDFSIDETVWAAVGEFVVESVTSQEQQTLISIAGADYLANLASVAFVDSATYPQTMYQILESACTQAGITLVSSSFVNSSTSVSVKPSWEENTSCRDVISYIACVAGGFAYIDTTGGLVISTLDGGDSFPVTPATYKSLDVKEHFGALNAISVVSFGAEDIERVEINPAISDNEHNSLMIKGNPLMATPHLTSIMDALIGNIGGVEFDSAKISWQGNPLVKVGDTISTTNLASETLSVMVLRQSILFSTGFSMESGNEIGTVTRESSNVSRLFTTTGKLNALSLEGDIRIKSGENISIDAGGTFTVNSGNFSISEDGDVTLSGAITAESGEIGGFSIGETTLEATPSGKPIMVFDSGESKITLGDMIIHYAGDAIPEIMAMETLLITANSVSLGDSGSTIFSVDTGSPGSAWCAGNISALSYTDRTPFYDGNALEELSKVKGDGAGGIDHKSLPSFARKSIKKSGKDDEEGRDLGAMISMLTRAVQQLTERVIKLEGNK